MIDAIIEEIKNADSVGILSHIHADGDALGSQLALAKGLKDLGVSSRCMNMKNLPINMAFLEGYDNIEQICFDDPWPSLMISVDCGSLERAGLAERPQGVDCWVNIDHHIGNSQFGDMNLVETDAAATCEIIADFFGENRLPMTPEVATCLFTGLSTDTGSFKYANTSARTFELASKLKEAGAKTDLIRLNIYESMSRGKFAIMQKLFSKTQFLAKGYLASTSISFNEAESLSPGESSFSNIVAQLKEIDGVEVSMLTRELEAGESKVSLRSKAHFDCNAFAKKYGGGGHARAAGLTINAPYQKVQKELEDALQELLIEKVDD